MGALRVIPGAGEEIRIRGRSLRLVLCWKRALRLGVDAQKWSLATDLWKREQRVRWCTGIRHSRRTREAGGLGGGGETGCLCRLVLGYGKCIEGESPSAI